MTRKVKDITVIVLAAVLTINALAFSTNYLSLKENASLEYAKGGDKEDIPLVF
ncbi:hypothetical protein [Acidaminobacter sp. JC074]|uniref:hypothetical protein n=1 Tax=Acidaminobacter sp. JC074 TaxID=2530199 RepID=UPI001F10DDAA|nr:hypothetical protein [Acidaminobacter sp. JC074]